MNLLLHEQIARINWLMLTEEEKIKNLSFNKRDSIINSLITKIGASKIFAEWAYDFSDKYCIWLLYALKQDRGIEYITGDSLPSDKIKNIIPNLFDVKNKPEIYIKELTLSQALDYLNRLNYINGWVNNPNTPTPDLTKMSWNQATQEAKDWRDDLEAGSMIEKEQGTILHKFSDGCYWINIHKSFDADEARSAGHCGEATRKDMVLISLRNSSKEVLLTFDYDEKTKEVIEFKGKANSKPVSKYHPYIIWVLSQKGFINKLNTKIGFKPENNFQLTDLTQEELEKVLMVNPVLGNE